jgi:diguanylate cyclase (GGDEF)-like protein/PAS domain S-box-containing protein
VNHPAQSIAQEGIYILDQERIILSWNAEAEHISGYQAWQVIGSSCKDNVLVHMNEAGEPLCLTQCPVSKTLRDGQKRESQVYLHHAAGHRVPVTVWIAPLYQDGQIIAAVETFAERVTLPASLQHITEAQKDLLDPLTQIGSRQMIEQNLSAAMSEWRNWETPFGLLLFEVDHYPQICDIYGEDIGRQVLQLAANTLCSNLRLIDSAGRWKDAVFAVIMPEVDVSGLQVMAERLRMLVEHAFIQLPKSVFGIAQLIRVTISVGASLVDDDYHVDHLLQCTQAKMEESRQNGHNRVTL